MRFAELYEISSSCLVHTVRIPIHTAQSVLMLQSALHYVVRLHNTCTLHCINLCYKLYKAMIICRDKFACTLFKRDIFQYRNCRMKTIY